MGLNDDRKSGHHTNTLQDKEGNLMQPPSKNAACPCGSGKKYKRCCGAGGQSDKPVNSPVDLNVGQLVQHAWQKHQQGDLETAIRLFDQALAIRPKEAILYGLRGMVSLEKGDMDAAIHIVQAGLKLAPGNPHLHNYLGQALGKAGDIAGAEHAFTRAVTLDPGLIEAWFNLATTQLDYGRPAEAINSYRQVLARTPEHGLTHIQLAKAHYYMRDLASAEQSLQRAKALGAHPARVGLWLAQILSAQGKTAESIHLENETIKQIGQPADAFGIFNELAETELHVGRFETAEAWLKKAISCFPNAPEPYCKLSKTHKFKESDSALVEKMESLLPGAAFNDRRELEFSLGKVYSDLGDHDAAFQHYKAGNDLVRSIVEPNLSAYIREADRLIDLFSSSRIAHLPSGSESDLPILIIGAPRSGTTLVEMLVCSHSKISSAGESIFWSRAGSSIMNTFPSNYSEKIAQKIAQQYISHLREHSATAKFVVDKMPENFWYLGLIHSILPNAKVIHCMRNPVDTCLSLYFQNLSDKHTYKWDLESLAQWFRQYQRLMAHWRATLPPGSFYDLRYESLVEDTEGESRKLLSYLGLDWEEGILDFHKLDRTVFTASKWQVRQQVYKTSKERWRRYEKHIGPLLDLLEN